MKTYYFSLRWPCGHQWSGSTCFLSDQVTIKGPDGMVTFEHLYSELETWAQSAGILYKVDTAPVAMVPSSKYRPY